MSIDPHHWRRLIVMAVHENNQPRIDSLCTALIEAEAAKRILRAKGYGASGLAVDKTAALVPHAMDIE